MAETRQEPPPEAVRLGATIRALREAYGLSAEELSGAVKISRRYLTYIEGGQKRPPLVLCRKIADVIGVPLAAITIPGYEEIRAAGRGSRADGSAA